MIIHFMIVSFCFSFSSHKRGFHFQGANFHGQGIATGRGLDYWPLILKREERATAGLFAPNNIIVCESGLPILSLRTRGLQMVRYNTDFISF